MLAMCGSRRVVHLDGNMELTLKMVVAQSDVWSWAQVVVQLFGVFLGASKRIFRYEDIILFCWWCRAVGSKAHALMLLMLAFAQLMA